MPKQCMKNLILFVLLCGLIFSFSIGHATYDTDEIWVKTAINGETIDASGNTDSDTLFPKGIPLTNLRVQGFFSIEILVSGSGTCKVEYKLSYDGTNFVDAGTDIATGLTAGRYIYGFPSSEPILAPYLQFIVTETGGADSVTVTLKVAIQ